MDTIKSITFSKYKTLMLFLTFCIFFLSFTLSQPLGYSKQIALSTLAGAAFLWCTETIPLYITAVLASFILLAFGEFSPKEIFQPYFDPVIVLFLGGFLLARSMGKYHLDELIAYQILKRSGNNPLFFTLGLMFVTAFLSMWMSNTASAAIMIPISIVVLRQNNLFSNESRFAKATVLAVAYSATIGGIGSLVGSPPNAIAAKFLGEQGLTLSFSQWMIETLPFVIVALLFTWAMLILLNPPEIKIISFTHPSRKLSTKPIMVLAIFLVTVMGWLTTSLTGLSSATVALLPIILLFITGLLNNKDLTKISWSTLILFGGGLSLGSALTQSGVDVWLASLMQHQLIGIHYYLIVLFIIFFSIFITMIASNTAAAAILIPLMLPLASSLSMETKTIAMLIAIATSLDFMMPIGTPPSAIAYSTGLVKVKTMIKNGFLINIGTGLILSFMFYFFL